MTSYDIYCIITVLSCEFSVRILYRSLYPAVPLCIQVHRTVDSYSTPLYSLLQRAIVPTVSQRTLLQRASVPHRTLLQRGTVLQCIPLYPTVESYYYCCILLQRDTVLQCIPLYPTAESYCSQCTLLKRATVPHCIPLYPIYRATVPQCITLYLPTYKLRCPLYATVEGIDKHCSPLCMVLANTVRYCYPSCYVSISYIFKQRIKYLLFSKYIYLRPIFDLINFYCFQERKLLYSL